MMNNNYNLNKMKQLFVNGGKRTMMLVLLLMVASNMMLWAQEMNEKFSMTTQMFLNEMKEKVEHPTAGPLYMPSRPSISKVGMKKPRRLIASPDTLGGVAYISCFIHLKDVNDLGAVQTLGVEVEETFDGLDFVTARVPVEQLNALADVENVTRIKVAQQMRPLTDAARQKTNVDDILTQSPDALAAGLSTKYDGTGVVLGIIDTGIDFQHIAFKDKNGNSRIKRAYIQTGKYTSSGTEYTESNISSATTDDNSEDHGTHTATTAGGSSVIVNGTNVTVTDIHSSATYGGMAPGADLYLAGIKGLYDTGLTAALNKMVTYANNQGKPLVVSNSWGSGWGPRDGTGEYASLVANNFGDTHPNRVILFASSNDAGHSKDNEGGGYFVKKSSASSSSPLGTIIRSASYSNTDAGYLYQGLIACAWSSSRLNCKIHVLNSSTGAILKSWTVTQNNTGTFSGLDTYYDGSMTVYIESDNGKYRLAVYSQDGIETKSSSGSSYYKSKYTLAIEVYPASGSANVDMWAGDYSYFTNHLTTSDHTWTAGTDDMCVSDEATIPNAISVGAYVSKTSVKNYQGTSYTYSSGSLGDIADFSSYATAAQSPTGKAYPWITAPGAQLVAGVNHYHTASIDEYSYFHSDNKSSLVVNNSSNPYGVMQGTSMATPVAAGIVALWLQAAKSVNKDLTVNDVKDIMEQTAIKDNYVTSGSNASHFGKGKIDALAGIQYILQTLGGPTIKATPTSIDFADKHPFATRSYTKTLNVQGLNLEGGITATLTDANGVYSLSQTSITQSAAADGVDITVTYSPQSAGTHTATITLTSTNADNVVVNVTATAQAATPTIIVDPETLTLTAGLNEQKSQTFEILCEFLTENVTITLNDANGVFSLDKTSITKADAEEGAEFTVTFLSATAGTYNGAVTLSSAGAESVTIPLTGKITSSDPNTTTFKLVTSTDELESGMRYIIACGSKATAAGAIESGNSYMSKQDVTVDDDMITIGNGVAVFVLEGNQTDGWSFKNESSNKYLKSSSLTLSYDNTEATWTLANGTNGVIMSSSDNGTMLYNVNSPRFKTYTSNPTAAMIQANLYMEYTDGSSSGGGGSTTPALAYYQSANGKKGSALKTSMCGIIYNRTEQSYNGLWSAFQTTDVRNDGKIWDMYSNKTNYEPGGSAQGANYSGEGDSYNREHSWPQSWFGGENKMPMYTDLHHIYPTDGFVNNKRANYPFGETNGTGQGSYQSNGGFSKLGSSKLSGYSGIVFEPADEYKGDFARTYFYMVTCYEEKLHDWFTNYSSTEVTAVIDGSTYPAFQTWQLNMLMEWAKNDPVSEKETNRNNAVYAIQNNRNPFIDYPGLQEYVWGNLQDETFSYDNYLKPVSLTFSASTATATVGVDFTEPTLTTLPNNLSVTYGSSDTSVATVDSNGEVTLIGAGSTIITATYAGSTTYHGLTVSYTLTVSASQSNSGNEFALVTSASDFGEGDYLIVYDGVAMNTTVSSDRLQYTEVTPSNNVITTSDATIIWHIAPSGSYYTIYNAGESKYAAATNSNNQAQLLTSGTDNKSLWSVSTGSTFDFQNKSNSRYLRRNGTYGFGCYAEGTGGKLSLYKRTSSSTPTNVAPTWSTLPSDATVTVGQTYELNLNNYVSGTPTPTITMASAANTTLTDGLFSFTPTAAGSYNFSFTATNSEGSANATLTVTVTLTAPTVPTELALSEVTATSLTASWSAVNYADSYEIDIVKGSSFEASTGGAVLSADFSSTTDWTLSGTGTYTGSNYYGAGSPSIKFDDTGDYAISPDFGSGSKLQFWAYGNGGSGSTFAISGFVNNSWTDIETITIAQGSSTYEVDLPSGTSKVRFDFTKSVNCALDDVVVYGPSNSPESVDGYPKTVGNTSTSITGLTPETQYAVRVRAVNTAGNSDWSSTVTATTTVANIAPVWSALPANVSVNVGDVYDLTISDYVSGIPAPTINIVSSTADENDYGFDDGYFLFNPSEAGTFSFTFTAINSEGSANATLSITVTQPPVTVPTLAVTEAAITATSAPATWNACDNVTSYTLQLASDDQFSTGGSGSSVTLVENDATSTSAPTDWTYNINNSSGSYLQLMSGNYVITEAFNASSCTDLELSLYMRTYGGTGNPSITVQYSADNGTTWSESLGTLSAANNTMAQRTLDISAAAGYASVRLRIASTSTSNSVGVGIKTIVITGTEAAGGGSLISTTTVNGTNHTFTGLTPETTYYARVKGNDDWSNVVSFTTNAAIVFANNVDNSDAISNAAVTGKRYDAILSGRKLFKDGAWNTLCLPFNLTAAQVTDQLAPTSLMELDKTTEVNNHVTGLEGNTLYLNFKDATSINAGIPYIIMWTKPSDYQGNESNYDIWEPTFTGVTMGNGSLTPVTSTDNQVQFIGTYGPVHLAKDNQNNLFLDADNTLSWPNVDNYYVNAFRAYFQLTPTNPNSGAREFVLNFGDDDVTTGIITMEDGRWKMEDAIGTWYSIDGRKLSGKPTTKGLYIHNGKTVVIK